MKIQLSGPCSIPFEELLPNKTGYYCQSCRNQVTDFSHMTDQQLLAHISRHGLGCGNFRDDQLGREIKTPRKPMVRIKLLYASFLAVFFLKSPEIKAQQKPSTEQLVRAYELMHPEITTTSIAKQLPADTIVMRRFGTGNVCSAKTIRWLKIPLTRSAVAMQKTFPFVRFKNTKKCS